MKNNGDANSLSGGNTPFFPVNKVRSVGNPPK